MRTQTYSGCPPVLLIVFKRPATTRQVMDAIRTARPPKLYVAADGPRPGRIGEAEACAVAREVATEVDWPCEVLTLFQEENLGCKLGVGTAIGWFFDHEPEGIILEDDVVPIQSFFRFCGELLEKYRDDGRISMIGGTNFQHGVKRGEASYYFSRMMHVWGWASWRRAWAKYDRDMTLWAPFKRSNGFRKLGLEGDFESWYTPNFEAVANGNMDTWDHQWMFACLAQNMTSIIPQENLVTNVGFGAGATHTRNSESLLSRMETAEISFPLRHPGMFIPDHDADLFTLKSQRHSWLRRVAGSAAGKLGLTRLRGRQGRDG